MAVQAAITMYKKDFIAAYEQRKSQLAMATTREIMNNGATAVFLVASSGGATAVTRGTNGNIPYSNPLNVQVPVTLKEKHAPFALTGFDVFASQGDQTKIMRDASMAVINRDQDLTILAAMANATQDFGVGVMTLQTILGAAAILAQNYVPTDEVDNMFGLLSPAANAYLMQIPQFSNGDWVDIKPFSGGTSRRYKRWADINWIVSPLVQGVGTNSELLYIWHRSAIGYASNLSEGRLYAGFDEKQGQSWSRAEIFHEAVLLQNQGIIKITHDGSAFVAT